MRELPRAFWFVWRFERVTREKEREVPVGNEQGCSGRHRRDRERVTNARKVLGELDVEVQEFPPNFHVTARLFWAILPNLDARDVNAMSQLGHVPGRHVNQIVRCVWTSHRPSGLAFCCSSVPGCVGKGSKDTCGSRHGCSAEVPRGGALCWTRFTDKSSTGSRKRKARCM